MTIFIQVNTLGNGLYVFFLDHLNAFLSWRLVRLLGVRAGCYWTNRQPPLSVTGFKLLCYWSEHIHQSCFGLCYRAGGNPILRIPSAKREYNLANVGSVEYFSSLFSAWVIVGDQCLKITHRPVGVPVSTLIPTSSHVVTAH
jgi:hypothetical protein